LLDAGEDGVVTDRPKSRQLSLLQEKSVRDNRTSEAARRTAEVDEIPDKVALQVADKLALLVYSRLSK
jgi:hypothetical protein